MTSARDALFNELQSFGMFSWNADEMIDAFAHELAEEIRKSASSGTLFVQDVILGMTISADLIDPEVN